MVVSSRASVSLERCYVANVVSFKDRLRDRGRKLDTSKSLKVSEKTADATASETVQNFPSLKE